MNLSVHNLTNDQIYCQYGEDNEKETELPPSSVVSLGFMNRIRRAYHRTVALRCGTSDARVHVHLSKHKMRPGASWNLIHDLTPWLIYTYFDQKKSETLLILPKRDLSAFLSEIPDKLPIYSLLLPGTHDSLAFYGWPVSQCQSIDTPLAVQLNSGIRVIDVRLAVKDSKLVAYHGVYPQKALFQDVLATIHTFLTSIKSSRETIVMSIKQEDFHDTPESTFSALVHDEIFIGPGGRDMWFLDNRVPTLGEVRGKVILLSRFGGDGHGWEGGLEGLGIHPTTWPDSEKFGFTWKCKNTIVRTHDWYAIPSFLSIPEKTAFATSILLPLEPPYERPSPILSISFLSASSFPLALPPTIACGFGWPQLGFGVEGVNSRVGRWLLESLSSISIRKEDRHCLSEGLEKGLAGCDAVQQDLKPREPRIRGWVLMDFYNDPVKNGVVPLLVECNFRGRRVGEEGLRFSSY